MEQCTRVVRRFCQREGTEGRIDIDQNFADGLIVALNDGKADR